MATFDNITPTLASGSGRQRWAVTLSAGDPTAIFSTSSAIGVTVELAGGGSVLHGVTGTASELRTVTTTESYKCEQSQNLFTFTPGTTATITIDEVGKAS